MHVHHRLSLSKKKKINVTLQGCHMECLLKTALYLVHCPLVVLLICSGMDVRDGWTSTSPGSHQVLDVSLPMERVNAGVTLEFSVPTEVSRVPSGCRGRSQAWIRDVPTSSWTLPTRATCGLTSRRRLPWRALLLGFVSCLEQFFPCCPGHRGCSIRQAVRLPVRASLELSTDLRVPFQGLTMPTGPIPCHTVRGGSLVSRSRIQGVSRPTPRTAGTGPDCIFCPVYNGTSGQPQ